MKTGLNKNLLIAGMGQYGFVAREIAQAMGCFERIAFLDDNNPAAIGKIADAKDFSDEYGFAVVAMGNPQMRLGCLERLSKDFQIATLIHPKSYVSPSASVGAGCIVEPMAVIHTEAQVAEGCLIGAGAVINHNSILRAGCHVDCNATVAARMEVPAHSKIPCGSVYANNK